MPMAAVPELTIEKLDMGQSDTEALAGVSDATKRVMDAYAVACSRWFSAMRAIISLFSENHLSSCVIRSIRAIRVSYNHKQSQSIILDCSCYPYFLYCFKNSITAACCICCCTIHSLYSFRKRIKCSVFSCPSIAAHILSAICGGKLDRMIAFCASFLILFSAISFKSLIVIIS